MTEATRILTPRFLAPRYWPTWLGLAAMWGAAQLPYRWQMRLGRLLGAILRRTATRRRHVAEVNLKLCFPELSREQRDDLLKRHFAALGMGMMEVALCWWLPPEKLKALGKVEGLEHVHAALAAGKGVILLNAHYTTVEISGTLLKPYLSFCVSYRPHKNPLYEAVLSNRRKTGNVRLISRHSPRAMVQALKDVNPMWYAPDQDVEGKHSVFAPFFGVPAATTVATAHLARLGNAVVIPLFPERLSNDQGYRITLQPPLENFPSGDDEQDIRRVNRIFEEQVRRIPEQYLWVHRRFKTRPPGETDPYLAG